MNERIFDILDQRGVKIQYLASVLEIKASRVYDWKRGKSAPSDKELAIIAKELDTTVSYLRGETDLNALNRIDRLRSEKGWSRSELLRRIGLSTTAFHDWKNGKSSPEKHLTKIAKELDTTVSYLRGETDDASPNADNAAPPDDDLEVLAASSKIPINTWSEEKKRELMRYAKYLNEQDDD